MSQFVCKFGLKQEAEVGPGGGEAGVGPEAGSRKMARPSDRSQLGAPPRGRLAANRLTDSKRAGHVLIFFTAMKDKNMTHEEQTTDQMTPLQIVMKYGIEGMKPAFEILYDAAMLAERTAFLKADAYERSSERTGYANGFKDRTLNTRIGQLSLRVPQTRGTETAFYPSVLERSQRSESAFLVAIATMWVNGVSTRKVTKVLEAACGTSVSSSTVSRAAARLDSELDAWRTRPLGEVCYLLLDAKYEKVRVDGVSRSIAILTAIGVLPCGKRSILGVSTSLSEAEIHWRNFLQELKGRGMHGIRMITSDDHEGLKAALKATLSGVPWQRCQFHLQQNAGHYVPRKADRPEVADDIRHIFNATDQLDAETRLSNLVDKHQKTNPRLATWLENNVPEGFTVFSLPKHHRKRLRTNNMVERINRELRRRTRVIGIFPNEGSLLRLAVAITMEISEEWEAAMRYLNVTNK